MMTGLQCIPCFREGNRAVPGQPITADPPFALAVVNGESVCLNHLHEIEDAR